MKLIMQSVVATMILSLFPIGPVGAQALPERTLIEQQKQRFDDFYRHQSRRKAFLDGLARGSEEYRKKRKKLADEAERARLEYLKRRSPQVDFSSPRLEREWLKRQARRQAAYLEEEKEFARVRRKAQQIEGQKYHIPADVELGLSAEFSRNKSRAELRKRRELEAQGGGPGGRSSGAFRDYEMPRGASDFGNSGPANEPVVPDSEPYPGPPPDVPPMDGGMDGGGDNVWDF